MIEAMACGTPVITSNSTSLSEIAGGAALLVDPQNIDEMVISLEKIIDSQSLVKELRIRGFSQVNQFSWEKTTDRIRKELKEIVG